MANTVPHLFLTTLPIFRKLRFTVFFQSWRLQITVLHGRLKLFEFMFYQSVLIRPSSGSSVFLWLRVLLMHGCKRRSTMRIWRRSCTSKLLYLLANNTHVSVARILCNGSLYLAQNVETAASTPSERKQHSTVSKLQAIQCGSASGLAPFFFFFFSAVTINKGSRTSKAGELSLRNKLQHSHYRQL